MKPLVWSLVALLVVLHQDVWFWDDDWLVFGFLPVALLYHALLSVAASLVWLLAVNVAWPVDEEVEERLAAAKLAAADRPVPKEKVNWRQGGDSRDVIEGAPA